MIHHPLPPWIRSRPTRAPINRKITPTHTTLAAGNASATAADAVEFKNLFPLPPAG